MVLSTPPPPSPPFLLFPSIQGCQKGIEVWMKKNILIVAAVALGIAFFEVWSRAEPLHVHKGGLGRAGVIPTRSSSSDPGHHLHLLPDEGHPQWLRGHVAPSPRGAVPSPPTPCPLCSHPGGSRWEGEAGGLLVLEQSPQCVDCHCRWSPPSECQKGLGDWEIKEKASLELVCIGKGGLDRSLGRVLSEPLGAALPQQNSGSSLLVGGHW